MATDTAFVIGCLALLGTRIPQSLRVFMLSLAIVDDIGAILVVAIAYSASDEGSGDTKDRTTLQLHHGALYC